jgi:D-alanyl-D-alanine carboxypeptidase
MGDASRGNEVTVRQLLGHTSGIHDYITDPSFVPDVLADPGHVWTPETLVEYAVTHGEAHFLPGAGFHYSDTGYVLLGMIVEQVTEGPLHDAYRTLVFDPLGMEETYLEGFEPARGLTLSHPYLGDFDGLDVHHSLDWSGGGLVSTTADLSRFITALHDGNLLEATTVADMTELQLTEDGGGYQVLHGLGYIGFRAGSFEMVGHDGSWGSFMYTVPETGVTVTGTVNQEQANQLDLVFELLQVLGT